ncbi:PAS domain S-box-containing protein [Chitinophaga costaii]|uniref:histidine kinase n=1 Tax=Chitinophaga costaii TaxID=1335309 RepID=A0A1C4FYW6_9BACT|nr:PAS domain S-box protein [Chitinophaga costaii]PUZ20928.1 PAS domain S-box protein [Chitinophaga costaii]SCC61064.1 PAS domain S-box-containing protein [Chitinophaga costaii]
MGDSSQHHKSNFDVLFNHATIGIIVTNDQGQIMVANPFLLNQFGYTDKEVVGQKVEKLIPARFHERHVGHRDKFQQHPRSRPMGASMELFAVRNDGSEFPVEVSLGAYGTEEGHFVIAFVSDISYRKQSEAALKQLNADLERKVEERTQSLTETVAKLGEQMQEVQTKDTELQRVNGYLESIWNHAEAIIVSTDKKGLIKLFNPAAERLLGYTAAETIDHLTPLVFHDPAEIAARNDQFSKELGQPILEGMETVTIKAIYNLPNEYEWLYYRKNGTTLSVSVNVSALRDAEGNITGYLCIGSDISERKRAENDLRVALEKEKELNELKSRFVSIASHEFRTPLSTVLSSAYLISKYEKQEEQPQRQKHLQRIISSVNMLTDILNDFLSVGKIEEGKIQVRISRFNVNAHISNVISEMHGLQKKKQTINYNHEGETMLVLDPALLTHIVMNLVSNAIKFSPEGAEITVHTTVTPAYFTLLVKDHGIGIAKEDQQHLFERFFRGGNVSNIQGTGLGLHIVARYAELLHGQVTCISELGSGAEFTIQFQNNHTI